MRYFANPATDVRELRVCFNANVLDPIQDFGRGPKSRFPRDKHAQLNINPLSHLNASSAVGQGLSDIWGDGSAAIIQSFVSL